MNTKPIMLTNLFIILFFCFSCEKEAILNEAFPIETTDFSDPHEEDTSTPPPIINLPDPVFNYANLNLPPFFNRPDVQDQDNEPDSNPVTNWGATLGRVLFYDKALSLNNTIACASCHEQESGFSDPNMFSTGFEGGLTGRNSMGLTNARYYARGSFFWDERAATLEDQVLMPIQDHVEMGMNLEDLTEKLSQLEYYPELFEQAFGDSEVSSDRISLALAQFIRSMVSYQSKYDEGLRTSPPGMNPGNVNFSNFTASENLGKALFFSRRTNCAACHGSINFVAPRPFNNGLDLVSEDNGVGVITRDRREEALFKVNSLRNIEMTAPYMHDGRFATLEQVIEHYNSGIQAHPNLSPQLRLPGNEGPNNVQPIRMNLSEEEKRALVDFLKTLTDQSFLQDERFSDPFQS